MQHFVYPIAQTYAFYVIVYALTAYSVHSKSDIDLRRGLDVPRRVPLPRAGLLPIIQTVTLPWIRGDKTCINFNTSYPIICDDCDKRAENDRENDGDSSSNVPDDDSCKDTDSIRW